MCGEATLGAGRLGDNAVIAVSQCIRMIGHIGDTAYRAYMSGIASLAAVGRCDGAVTGCMLGVQHAVNIEHVLTVFEIPAVLKSTHQGVGIGERCVIGTKGSTPVAGIFRIDIGGKAVGFLIGGIPGEGIQRAGGKVELIAEGTAVDRRQTAVFIPGSIGLGRQCDASDQADGIGSGRFNGSGLLHPIQRHGQHIGLGIKFCAAESEIFILQAEPRQIYIEIGVNGNGSLDLGQVADPVRQLQQEAPGGAVGLICAGQHTGQILQPVGNLDGSHVDGKGVIGDHGHCRIHNMVGIAVLGGGIGNVTEPCQLPAAAGGMIKVEDHIAGIVQRNGNGVADIGIGAEHGGNRDGLQTGFCIGGEAEAGDDAAGDAFLVGTDLEFNISGDQGNRLSLI